MRTDVEVIIPDEIKDNVTQEEINIGSITFSVGEPKRLYSPKGLVTGDEVSG